MSRLVVRAWTAVRGCRRLNKLLARVGESRLQIRQLPSDRLQLPVEIGQLAVPRSEVVSQPGQIRLSLRSPLLEALKLGHALVTIRGQARKCLLSLGSPLSELLKVAACCRDLLPKRCLGLAHLLNPLLGLRQSDAFVAASWVMRATSSRACVSC